MRSFITIILLYIIPIQLLAQITNCNGEWTNKPCSGNIEASFEELQVRTKSEEDLIRDQKRTILNELESLRFKAKKEHNLEFSTLDANAICQNDNILIEECRSKAQIKIDEINNKINELEVSKNVKDREKDSSEEPVKVTVTENRIIDTGLWIIPNNPNLKPNLPTPPPSVPEQPNVIPKPVEPVVPVAPRKPSYGTRK